MYIYIHIYIIISCVGLDALGSPSAVVTVVANPHPHLTTSSSTHLGTCRAIPSSENNLSSLRSVELRFCKSRGIDVFCPGRQQE